MPLLCPVPRVYLKPPMSMDTMQSPWWSWSEFCYHAKTKARTSSDVFRPKQELRNHLRASNFRKFFLVEHTPRPPSLILCIWVQESAQAGPMPCCFCLACVFVSICSISATILSMYVDVWSCFQEVFVQSTDKFISRFTAKRMLLLIAAPPLNVFQWPCLELEAIWLILSLASCTRESGFRD